MFHTLHLLRKVYENDYESALNGFVSDNNMIYNYNAYIYLQAFRFRQYYSMFIEQISKKDLIMLFLFSFSFNPGIP